MNKTWSPSSVHTPKADYNHCVLVEKASQTLHIAGQLGITPRGELLTSVEDQVVQAWKNVQAILIANDMNLDDLVSVRLYLTDRESLGSYAKAKTRLFDISALPITLIFVAGLFDPLWKVEIEAQAAKKLN
jgi:enamine deaminase RidA (YjgF/YER057c/UK114 family)